MPAVPPAAWLAALSGRAPLVLAPSDARGWFGGRTLVAFDPVVCGGAAGVDDEALAAAGRVLEDAFLADSPCLAVALLPYSGDVRWAVYRGGLELRASGWRRWGSEPAGGWPEVGASAASAGPRGPLATQVATSLDRAAYVAAVEATREAILAGDVYVLNLTRTVEATTSLDAATLFSAMGERASATMAAAWVQDEGSAIVSVSPERFLRVAGHEVEIAPVKGTRPRGPDARQDAALAAELAASEKERAEHVMVVDLERNDLGRVCVPGSIRVDPLCEIEATPYCHQMVSSVRGLLSPEASLGELLSATFPCGSITGAPKIAAMRIAEELEGAPREAYTGSLVVATPGYVDSSVLIRTVEADRADSAGDPGGVVRYGTGCGITVDSDADEEWLESVLKARPLLGE